MLIKNIVNFVVVEAVPKDTHIDRTIMGWECVWQSKHRDKVNEVNIDRLLTVMDGVAGLDNVSEFAINVNTDIKGAYKEMQIQIQIQK